jgi:hypothetical protein
MASICSHMRQDMLDFYGPEIPGFKFRDPALPAGSEWTDPYSDLSIRA